MIYPEEGTRNDTAAFIYWFYVHFLGKQPDATHYSSGTRILSGVFKADKKYKGARVYTPKEAANALVRLRNSGVDVRSIGILKFPDLLSASVQEDASDFERIVTYLKGDGDSELEWKSVPDGW